MLSTEFKRSIDISNKNIGQARQEILDYDKKYSCYDKTELSIDGEIHFKRLVFSTSKGVFFFDPDQLQLTQILKGKFYGITRNNNFWFFTRSNNKGYRDHLRNDRISDICMMEFHHGIFSSPKVVAFNIPGEIHQFDIIDFKLVIPHTDFKQLIYIDIEKLLDSKPPLQLADFNHIPLDVKNHAHLNSIFSHNGKWYVVAHNYAMTTGDMSELIIYDPRTQLQECQPLNAHSAHNIYMDNDHYWYCDSNRYTLNKNAETFYHKKYFMRGLSMTHEYIFLGGSDICYKEYKRYSNTPKIFILNKNGDSVAELTLPNLGDIYEIRQVDDKDLCMNGGA